MHYTENANNSLQKKLNIFKNKNAHAENHIEIHNDMNKNVIDNLRDEILFSVLTEP